MSATAEYVWTETRQLDPDARPRKSGGSYHTPAVEKVERRALRAEWPDGKPLNGQTVYPQHVGGMPPARDGLDKLIAEGVQRLEADHRAAYTDRLLAPLKQRLEPEAV